MSIIKLFENINLILLPTMSMRLNIHPFKYDSVLLYVLNFKTSLQIALPTPLGKCGAREITLFFPKVSSLEFCTHAQGQGGNGKRRVVRCHVVKLE